jgi:hypothetical protein
VDQGYIVMFRIMDDMARTRSTDTGYRSNAFMQIGYGRIAREATVWQPLTKQIFGGWKKPLASISQMAITKYVLSRT